MIFIRLEKVIKKFVQWCNFLTLAVLGRINEKVKSAVARSLPVENLLHQNVGKIINYMQ